MEGPGVQDIVNKLSGDGMQAFTKLQEPPSPHMNAKTQDNYKNFGKTLTPEFLISVDQEINFEGKYQDGLEFKWKGRAKGKYCGQTKNGVPNGIGRWEQDNGGQMIDGVWQNGVLHGFATFNYGQEYFEGFYKNDERNG